jgi:hypothetical protein
MIAARMPGLSVKNALKVCYSKRIMDAADTGAELLAYDMASGADLAA